MSFFNMNTESMIYNQMKTLLTAIQNDSGVISVDFKCPIISDVFNYIKENKYVVYVNQPYKYVLLSRYHMSMRQSISIESVTYELLITAGNVSNALSKKRFQQIVDRINEEHSCATTKAVCSTPKFKP